MLGYGARIWTMIGFPLKIKVIYSMGNISKLLWNNPLKQNFKFSTFHHKYYGPSIGHTPYVPL